MKSASLINPTLCRRLSHAAVYLMVTLCMFMLTWVLVSPYTKGRAYLSSTRGARCSTAHTLDPATVATIAALGDDNCREPEGPTFLGTRVPRRVVVVFFSPGLDDAKLSDVMPSLQASANSWLDDPGAPGVELVYFGSVAARAFLDSHYPRAVVSAWDALIPGAYKADLFRYAEILLNGGLYVDIKDTRVATIAEIVGYNGTLFIDRVVGKSGLYNGIFAAPPRSPWVARALLQALRNIDSRNLAEDGIDITGPRCLCRGFCEWLGDPAHPGNSCEFLRPGDILRGMGIVSGDYVHLEDSVERKPTIHSRSGSILVTTYNPSYRLSQARNSPQLMYDYAWRSRQVYSFDADCVRTILAFTAPALADEGNSQFLNFADTRVPRRLVTTSSSPLVDDLDPARRTSVFSWLDYDTAAPVEHVHYGSAAARSFLLHHFPGFVVDAWDSLHSDTAKAELFRYAEALVNGGIFVDADENWTRRAPLADVVGVNGTLVVVSLGAQDSSGLMSSLFAAPRGSLWIARVLLQALMNVDSLPFGDRPHDPTGQRCMCRGFCNWYADPLDVGQSCDFLLSGKILEEVGILPLVITADDRVVAAPQEASAPTLVTRT